MGIAVAADDSLIVPTVFDADRKSLLEIAREARTLAERVRSRQITPAELSGGDVHGVQPRDVRRGRASPRSSTRHRRRSWRSASCARSRSSATGRSFPGSRMSIVLTCDHRILYGAPAAEFLARVRQLLEQPLNLLL